MPRTARRGERLRISAPDLVPPRPAAARAAVPPDPTPRAIIVEGLPPPVADPQLALAAKMLKGTEKDLAYCKMQREEERAKADQLQAKIERLKEEG